jgi:hypothetical protein
MKHAYMTMIAVNTLDSSQRRSQHVQIQWQTGGRGSLGSN